MNPFGLLYSEVTASSLVRVSVEEGGSIVDGGSTRLGVNRAGLELHSAIYGARRDVHCIMHLHTVAGAAVRDYWRHTLTTVFKQVFIIMSGVSNELWTAPNIRGSTKCESNDAGHHLYTFTSLRASFSFYQVGKVAYYDGRRPLTSHRERKEFTKALGKNKVTKCQLVCQYGEPQIAEVCKGREEWVTEVHGKAKATKGATSWKYD